MKYKFRVYIVLSMLFLPALLILYYPSLSGESKIEFRELQNIPGLPSNFQDARHWPRDFDRFTSDRFPFREQLISVAGELFHNAGLSISPEVFIGSDGWLFLRRNGDVLDESRGIKRLDAEQLQAWADRYVGRRDFLLGLGIETLLVIAPNKHTIYPQYLLDRNFQVNETITDQIFSELGRRGVEGIIDLRALLKDKSNSESVYGRYNTHWNDRGAYFAYQAIIGRLPGAHELQNDALVFKKGQVRGDLSRLIGNADWTEESMILDVSNIGLFFEHDPNDKAMNYMEDGWTSKTSLTKTPRVLFLCDSFTIDYLYKYLGPSFREASFRYHDGMKLHGSIIEKFKPDYVVYIVAERLIPYSLN